GPAINTDGQEYEAELSRDGKRVIINTADAMYESTFDGKTWTPRVRMSAEINVNGSEIGALLSPSGHSMLFARDTKDAASGEFFLWNDGTAERWPPTCGIAR